MTNGPTVMDLVTEALRKSGGDGTLSLTDIAERTGIAANSISVAISKVMRADPGCGIERPVRGVYRWVGVTLDDEGQAAESERSYHPPGECAKEAGRMRRVRTRMRDLADAMADMDRYVTKLEAKARAYDKVQLTINGRIEDPL